MHSSFIRELPDLLSQFDTSMFHDTHATPHIRIIRIIESYQEFPELLDAHLEQVCACACDGLVNQPVGCACADPPMHVSCTCLDPQMMTKLMTMIQVVRACQADADVDAMSIRLCSFHLPCRIHHACAGAPSCLVHTHALHTHAVGSYLEMYLYVGKSARV